MHNLHLISGHFCNWLIFCETVASRPYKLGKKSILSRDLSGELCNFLSPAMMDDKITRKFGATFKKDLVSNLCTQFESKDNTLLLNSNGIMSKINGKQSHPVMKYFKRVDVGRRKSAFILPRGAFD